jgi:hypothetical protein
VKVEESEEKISVYHGSINEATQIQAHGFDSNRCPSFISRDINAARNAIGPNRYEVSQGLAHDLGIIESRIPKGQFQRLLQPNERIYHGFGGRLVSTEIPLRTPEEINLFNTFIVKD